VQLLQSFDHAHVRGAAGTASAQYQTDLGTFRLSGTGLQRRIGVHRRDADEQHRQKRACEDCPHQETFWNVGILPKGLLGDKKSRLEAASFD
jgi:hypothetical protein